MAQGKHFRARKPEKLVLSLSVAFAAPCYEFSDIRHSRYLFVGPDDKGLHETGKIFPQFMRLQHEQRRNMVGKQSTFPGESESVESGDGQFFGANAVYFGRLQAAPAGKDFGSLIKINPFTETDVGEQVFVQ